MKHFSSFRIFNFVLFLALLGGIQSCSKDAEKDLMAENSQLSQTELSTILEADQWTGVLDEVLLDLYEKNTAAAAKFADDNCYEITYTETGFRVVFDNCILNTTDAVNGVLEVTYASNPEVTSFTVSYSEFFVGTVQLNGIRTITVSQEGDRSLLLSVSSEMTVVFEDGTTLTENGIKNLEFQFGESLGETSYSITGDWTVTNGNTIYSVSATEPLNGTLLCEYLVSGLMDIDKNGLELRVDFGDGSCDNLVTIIYPSGATEEIEL